MAVKLTKRELNALIKSMKLHGIDWSAIYLFGSTAKGYATKHSDRDFCVLVKKKSKDISHSSIKVCSELGMSGFNFDIVFTTEKDYLKNKISPIMHEIRTTGIKVA